MGGNQYLFLPDISEIGRNQLKLGCSGLERMYSKIICPIKMLFKGLELGLLLSKHINVKEELFVNNFPSFFTV